MTWFDDLYQRVEQQGQRPHILESGDGRLLVVEHGARILAVELPGVDHNLIFHTDSTPDGKTTGGDRLWIAPEVAYFWPNLNEALRDSKGTASTPSEIDPNQYSLENASKSRIALRGVDVTLQDIRDGRKLDLLAPRRSFFVVTPDTRDPAISCFCFSTENVIALGESGQAVGAWSILQIPPTGTLICPVTKRLDGDDEVRSYYDPFGDKHVVIEDRCVKFLIDGKRRVKMGIRPEHTTGRMGYYRKLDDGRSSLIVRVFAPLPGEPYCDLPRDDPRHRQLEQGEIDGPVLGGDCLQAYNDDGDAFAGTTFGEMEYHDPCVVAGQGPQSRCGSCVTRVVAGPDNVVKAWGQVMLGVEVSGIE